MDTIFTAALKWLGSRAPNRGHVLASLAEGDTVLCDGLSLLLKALRSCGFDTASEIGLMDGENSVPSCALFRPLLNTELVERSLLELLNEVPDSVRI